MLTNRFTGAVYCEEIPLQVKEVREKIAAERANGTSAQVQVCAGAF
jgi:hypothetical protein